MKGIQLFLKKRLREDGWEITGESVGVHEEKQERRELYSFKGYKLFVMLGICEYISTTGA